MRAFSSRAASKTSACILVLAPCSTPSVVTGDSGGNACSTISTITTQEGRNKDPFAEVRAMGTHFTSFKKEPPGNESLDFLHLAPFID